MITGHNSNIRHGGRVFHVQTEDSGRRRPRVTTLLYFEGTILVSERADYAAMLDAEDLDARVRRLMDEQHAAVIARLRRGDFDAVIEGRLSGAARQTPPTRPPTPPTRRPAPPTGPPPPPAPRPVAPTGRPRPSGETVAERPLDDAILDYLVARSRERSGGGGGPRSGG